MSYDEAFWLATAAAAPVIALAAVIGLPDSFAATISVIRVEAVAAESKVGWVYEGLRIAARIIRWTAFANVLVQAGLLGMSLSALATRRNIVPPWVAIVLAVTGIAVLAFTSTYSMVVRQAAEALAERKHS